MEQKRFGVKSSLVEELRLFQLALKQKRMKMPFETKTLVQCNSEEVEKTVKASIRTITITPWNPPIANFKLPRQQLIVMGETDILLRINDCINLNITFATLEERLRFTQALGDLDPQSSSSDSDESD
ncbi:uncharacterized protein LOC135140259 [Zophobas morio]|uniref:uncharacterized protein LOC135140259 n=1 Tax=Zophobas morio TaxID=2755281 RepID=UPI003082F027